jgi:hypothetical protein
MLPRIGQGSSPPCDRKNRNRNGKEHNKPYEYCCQLRLLIAARERLGLVRPDVFHGDVPLRRPADSSRSVLGRVSRKQVHSPANEFRRSSIQRKSGDKFAGRLSRHDVRREIMPGIRNPSGNFQS